MSQSRNAMSPILKFALAIAALLLLAWLADFIGLVDAIYEAVERNEQWLENQRN